jgi:hypothetical protein
MRTKLLLILALLLTACAQRQPETLVVVPPTAKPTTAPTNTVAPTVLPPTETPEPLPTATPEPEGTGGGGVDTFVILANLRTDPAQLIVADPVTGDTISTFTAVGLTELSTVKVGGPFIFYLDSNTQKIMRVGFDGSATQLTFITEGLDYFPGDFLPSPDGTLIAWGTNTFDPAGGNATRSLLKVANVDGSDEKVIYDETLDEESILPQPIQWSPDGSTFYYTDLPYGIGGYILFGGGPDLKKVDVASGAVTEVLPKTGCLCAMTVSPDGGMVASITGAGPLELLLHHVETGNERKLEIDAGHLQGGNILWSADGKTLLYTMAVSNFDNPEAEKYAVVKVNVETLEQTVMVADNESLYNTMMWVSDETVWLNDKDGNAWMMNAGTGGVKEAEAGFRVVRDR